MSLPTRAPRFRTLVFAGAWGAMVGGLPYVLYHLGPLAGAAFLVGTTGKLTFGVAGLTLLVPWLLRVRRLCASWTIPLLLLVAFAGVWAVSTFVTAPGTTGHLDPDPATQTSNEESAPSDDERHPREGPLP